MIFILEVINNFLNTNGRKKQQQKNINLILFICVYFSFLVELIGVFFLNDWESGGVKEEASESRKQLFWSRFHGEKTTS